jgi:phosphoribosylformimino-5-aminoimidazole carboxamide ribotide isomerase
VILFPAIDLKNGQAVRLQQGDMARATVFNRDPAAQAAAFERQGFDYLHIVDLDGAFAGKPINAAAVERILAAVKIPAQLGGGIRDRATIEGWLDKGVARVVIGTAAVRNPALVKEAARAYPGHVAVGLDARDGKVAVEGWAETSEMSALDLAKRFEDTGVAAIVYTDVSRDGMLKGLNIHATKKLADAVSVPVIASGGLASIDDICALLDPRISFDRNIAGVIAGRALYDGRLDATQALDRIRAHLIDALTGLHSRRGFSAQRQLIAARMKSGDCKSVILFDIDNFAQFNYDHNHMIGDEVIRRIAVALKEQKSAVAARLGGDEFALLLSGLRAADVRQIAERYLHDFSEMRIDGVIAKISCSFGVGESQAGETIEGMIARAEAALDAAKRLGRGRVVVAQCATAV